jgi:hypothetical protein
MTTTEVPWLDIVLEADDEYYETEDVYEFSNGRTFESTDKTDSGVYDGS